MPADNSYPVRIFTRVQRQPNGSGVGQQPGKKVVTVTFDEDTLSAVIKLAIKSRCRMSQQIRTLVEWGLESIGNGS